MDLCQKFSRPVNGGVVLKYGVIIWSAGRENLFWRLSVWWWENLLHSYSSGGWT